MKIAIHQPNYFPWAGFWHKVAQADILILLDTVAFSKGSYTNRVRCIEDRWLTIPVQASSGTPLTDVWPADPQWPMAHLDKLQNWYRDAPHCAAVFPLVASWLQAVPHADVATINEGLLRATAQYLGLSTKICCASELGATATDRTGRLVELCQQVSPEPGTYLTGQGGLAYLDHTQFQRVGWQVEAVTMPPTCSPYSILHTVFMTGHAEHAL